MEVMNDLFSIPSKKSNLVLRKLNFMLTV